MFGYTDTTRFLHPAVTLGNTAWRIYFFYLFLHVSHSFPLFLMSPFSQLRSSLICMSGQVFMHGDNCIYPSLQHTYIHIQSLRGDNGAENKEKLFLCRPSQKAWASKLQFSGIQFDQAKPKWVRIYGLPTLKSIISLFRTNPLIFTAKLPQRNTSTHKVKGQKKETD